MKFINFWINRFTNLLLDFSLNADSLESIHKLREAGRFDEAIETLDEIELH